MDTTTPNSYIGKITSKSFFKTLDAVDQGVIVVSPEEKIIFLNEYLKKFLGIYNFENVPLSEILKVYQNGVSVELGKLCPPFELQKEGTVFQETNTTVEDALGNLKSAKVVSHKYKSFQEEGISCIITISDITKEKELEKMKIDFSAQSVHILRTPISIIRNNLDFMKREAFTQKLTDDEKKFVLGVATGVDQLRDLVENMISLTDIQSEKIKLSLISTSLVYLLKQVVEDLKLEASKKGVGLIFLEPLYLIPSINIDSMKMYDVFKTVISNAIKFSENDNVIISLTKDPQYLVIKVIDKGKGIPEVGLRNIFSKFYHSKSSPLEMSSGLGISLYMSKKIIDAHMGIIEVESKENVGTTVTIKLKYE